MKMAILTVLLLVTDVTRVYGVETEAFQALTLWQYPNGKTSVNCPEGQAATMFTWTADPFPKVWRFYADKCGFEEEDKFPEMWASGGPRYATRFTEEASYLVTNFSTGNAADSVNHSIFVRSTAKASITVVILPTRKKTRVLVSAAIPNQEAKPSTSRDKKSQPVEFGMITGRLLDEQKRPMRNREVYAYGGNAGQLSTSTDDSGAFEFRLNPGFEYRLRLSESSTLFNPFPTTVKVVAGKTKDIGTHVCRVREDRAFLGIGPASLDPGAAVGYVAPNSPAEEAGIRKGDVILKFDGKEVTAFRDLQDLMATRKANDRVTVKIRRGDKTLSLQATLSSNL